MPGQSPNVPIAGTPWVMRLREPRQRSTRNPRNAIAAGVRMPSDTESTALRDASPSVTQPGVGVQVVGEERAEPGRCSTPAARAARSRAPCAGPGRGGGTPAGGARGRGCEYQLPMAGARPARMPGEQVAERLDEPHDEPDRHQPEQLVQRVRREQHTHPRPRQRELVGPVVAQRRRPPRGGDARVGHDEHARAGEPGAPAEVEVLGPGERRGIEPLEGGEEVGAHEHRRGA